MMFWASTSFMGQLYHREAKMRGWRPCASMATVASPQFGKHLLRFETQVSQFEYKSLI
jgi:hypothetical protein